MTLGTHLSDSATRELEKLQSEAPSDTIGRWIECTDALEKYRKWSRRALAENHLVAVASHLHRKLRIEPNHFKALGIPVDLLGQFPRWRAGSRVGFRVQPSGLRASDSGAASPIGWMRVQLSPAPLTTPYALVLLRDLLRQMDSKVRFTVIVEPGANIEGLRDIVRGFRAGAVDRVHFAELGCQSVFAQDNAMAARDGAGTPVLLIPRASAYGQEIKDALSVEDAQRAFGIRALRSRLYWEGGNILHGPDHCLIGVDTIAENMRRLGLTRREVMEMFAAELGVEVTALGDQDKTRFDWHIDRLSRSGQAAFHIDLDVSLLGSIGPKRKPVALIADPARGLDLLSSVLARRALYTNHFLSSRRAHEVVRAGYDAYARERHPKLLGYNVVLEKCGYRVIGMPDVRINPQENLFRPVNLDFSYCNVLPGLRGGRPAVYYLPWGIRRLDEEAERKMRQAGVNPVRVSSPRIANLLMSLSGGLHCFCGPLQ